MCTHFSGIWIVNNWWELENIFHQQSYSEFFKSYNFVIIFFPHLSPVLTIYARKTKTTLHLTHRSLSVLQAEASCLSHYYKCFTIMFPNERMHQILKYQRKVWFWISIDFISIFWKSEVQLNFQNWKYFIRTQKYSESVNFTWQIVWKKHEHPQQEFVLSELITFLDSSWSHVSDSSTLETKKKQFF